VWSICFAITGSATAVSVAQRAIAFVCSAACFAAIAPVATKA